MKITMSDIKNPLDDNTKLDIAEEKINKLEDSNRNFLKWNMEGKNIFLTDKQSISEMLDNF